MTPSGGKRKSAGRKPLISKGTRKHFYLAPDLIEWWGSIPEREKSALINQAIREMIVNHRL